MPVLQLFPFLTYHQQCTRQAGFDTRPAGSHYKSRNMRQAGTDGAGSRYWDVEVFTS